MKKFNFALLPVLAVTGLLLVSVPVMAMECPHCGKGKAEAGLDEKFMDKAHFILDNSAALGLSEAQEKTIHELKLGTKKSLIQQDAEIELVATDIKSKLYEDKLDVAGINQLVDKKYELKKARTKGLVEALAKLKGQLNAGQMKKLKDLYQSKK